ncbi:MAG: hypothetical protein WD737_14580 [Gemmatimonadota bacterium]
MTSNCGRGGRGATALFAGPLGGEARDFRPRTGWRVVGLLVGLCWIAVSAAPAVSGQETDGPRYQQVVSANPFGILLEVFNAEYERVINESATAGFGGSYLSLDDDDYLNADVFWRFYVGSRPLEGWAFGAKMGVTNVPDSGSFFGVGFDANHSWLLGNRDNFYVGLGFGLKRLFGAGDEAFDLQVIPTIRVINVGIAF